MEYYSLRTTECLYGASVLYCVPGRQVDHVGERTPRPAALAWRIGISNSKAKSCKAMSKFQSRRRSRSPHKLCKSESFLPFSIWGPAANGPPFPELCICTWEGARVQDLVRRRRSQAASILGLASCSQCPPLQAYDTVVHCSGITESLPLQFLFFIFMYILPPAS
jgi:hypothetical protein